MKKIAFSIVIPLVLFFALGMRSLPKAENGLTATQSLTWTYWEYARLEVEDMVESPDPYSKRTNKCFWKDIFGIGDSGCGIDKGRIPSVGEYLGEVDRLKFHVAVLDGVNEKRNQEFEEARALYRNERPLCRKSCLFSFGNFMLIAGVLGVVFVISGVSKKEGDI